MRKRLANTLPLVSMLVLGFRIYKHLWHKALKLRPTLPAMNRSILVVIIAGVLVSLLFLFFSQQGKAEVCFEKNCFAVERAQTQQELHRGLMYLSSLPIQQGMLFIFPKPGIYPFWMKNMSIPLDILWLDASGKVVYLAKQAQPCPAAGECRNIVPDVPARYVLEINAGLVDSYQLGIGTKATSSFFTG